MNLVGTRPLRFGPELGVARHESSFLFIFVRLSSGADGHVSGTVDYDIFGEPVTETGVFAGSAGSSGGISALVFAYAGKPYDSVTGLSDYGFRDYAPTLARFTTVDPIRDGSNWYAYCNSDPVNYVDAWGLFGNIVASGNEITINIPIEFYGTGATEESINKTINSIESEWSGTFGEYTVTTTVTAVSSVSGPGTGGWATTTTANKVELIDGRGTSFVINGTNGVWYTDNNFYGIDYYPKTAAHETGHLLGARDRYIESVDSNGNRMTPPEEGYESNLMASLNGNVEQRTIEEILQSPNNNTTSNSPTVEKKECRND